MNIIVYQKYYHMNEMLKNESLGNNKLVAIMYVMWFGIMNSADCFVKDSM